MRDQVVNPTVYWDVYVYIPGKEWTYTQLAINGANDEAVRRGAADFANGYKGWTEVRAYPVASRFTGMPPRPGVVWQA